MDQVILIRETKSFLTKEDKDGSGKPTGAICDRAGNALSRDSMNQAREVFMGVDGAHYMRVSPDEAAAATKAKENLYQGMGEVHGLFVEAPDHTLIGRHGERAA